MRAPGESLTIEIPQHDVRSRAAKRLADVRARLAFFVTSKKQAEDMTCAEVARVWCSTKNMVFRMMNPDDPKYDGCQIEPMMRAMEWCGIGFEDLEPKRDRPAVLADVSQKIMQLDWPESKRLALRSATEHLWRVLEQMK